MIAVAKLIFFGIAVQLTSDIVIAVIDRKLAIGTHFPYRCTIIIDLFWGCVLLQGAAGSHAQSCGVAAAAGVHNITAGCCGHYYITIIRRVHIHTDGAYGAFIIDRLAVGRNGLGNITVEKVLTVRIGNGKLFAVRPALAGAAAIQRRACVGLQRYRQLIAVVSEFGPLDGQRGCVRGFKSNRIRLVCISVGIVRNTNRALKNGRITPGITGIVIAGLNIAERRIPQDGRINYNYGKDQTVDMRISILPGAFGETIVIRITTALEFKLDKHSIGFNYRNLELFDRILSNTHGLILLTGPTGSGKTTTLYAALSEIDKPDINIITVEDPVEMIMENMTQVEVNAKTGLTFATVMRSILRQDPDVVMVGEIRDEETAKIAMTLSITGHLVFSTLHTYDSPSAVLRLVDMGVEPYMVYSALSAVISQRLVRKLCPHCRRQYEADAEEKRLLGVDPLEELYIYKAKGCDECNKTGYRGRTAVHEILMMSPAIRDDLANGGSTESVGRIAKEEGMKTLRDNLQELVIMGITSVDEMRRTYSEYV